MLNARENRDPDAGLRRKAAVLASILAVIGLIVGSLFGDRGMLNLLEQQKATQELERQLDDLQNGRLARIGRSRPTRERSSGSRGGPGPGHPGDRLLIARTRPLAGRDAAHTSPGKVGRQGRWPQESC
jgi:hypothetical protein